MLKRISFILIFTIITCRVMAESALRLTPSTCKDISKVADLWISTANVTSTDLGKVSCKDSFSGKILRVLVKGNRPQGYFANYKFSVKTAGKYKLYGGLIHQRKAHGSTMEFRFDKGEWQKIVPIKGPRSSWGVSQSINWEPLGTFYLTTGEHRLDFRALKPAALGKWSVMCDGIIGFDVKKKVAISDLISLNDIKPGNVARFQFQSSGNSMIKAELKLANSFITSESLSVVPGKNQFNITLPVYLGGNEYTVGLYPVFGGDEPLAKYNFSIASPAPRKTPTIIKTAKVTDNSFDATLKSEANEEKRVILAFLFIANKLYHVDIITVPAGRKSISGKFSKGFVKVAAGRDCTIKFMGCPGAPDNEIPVNHKFAGKSTPLPKPMNYGVFTDYNSVTHPWFINHRWQYIFDGKPYFPVGGMWCPNTLISPGTTTKGIKARLAHDLKTLQNIKKHGIDDVYLNMSHVAPIWVRQYFLDMLERENIYYGYQLGGGKGNIPSFFITWDRKNARRNWKGLIHGKYANGKIEAELPKTYKVRGLLIIPETNNPSKSFMLSFVDKEGKDNRHGIIDLETVADYEKTRKVAVKAKLPLLNNSKVIIIPELDSRMHHADLWNDQARADLLKRLSWIKDIQWGPHLRCFVDIAKNETNMLNGTENLRQYTPEINRDFAKWLKRKYTTLAKLRNAWKVAVENFETASRLIPLRLNDKLLLLDPQSGNILPTNLKTSLAWLDYNEMIRVTYAEYLDNLTIDVKRMVNVPIVIKSVGVAGSQTHMSRKYLGWDGTGYEIYGDQGFPPQTGGGASRAEAEASSHTMWKVGTELGNSAQVGNRNVKFFKDEKAIQTMARELSLSGVNGFYFFGFDLEPSRMWKNHNYDDFPQGLQWVSKVDKKYSDGKKKASPSSFSFPMSCCYWWWTTRNKAVYGYEANTIKQSVRLHGDEWVSNTDVLPEKFNRVVINCPYPPFSIKYAPEINRVIQENRKVIYMGERTDLGSISKLDKYFTKSKIKFKDGSTAQVLRKLPGVKVLASKHGKPWAIRHGNLMIVSRTPVKYNKAGFKYLDKAWIDRY